MSQQFFNRKDTNKTRSIVIEEPSAPKDVAFKLSEVGEFIQLETNQKILNGNGHIDFKQIGTFDLTDPVHRTVLSKATNDYQQNLAKLHQFDKKIAGSFILGTTALAFTPLLPFLTLLIAIPAFCYGGYQLGKREDVYSDYKKSLESLKSVYIWCLNDPNAKVDTNCETLDLSGGKDAFSALHGEVQDLVTTAAPMLSDKELIDFTRNDIDNELKAGLREKDEKAIANQTTSKVELSLSYLFYGSHQGGAWSILRGLFTLSKNAMVNGALTTWAYLNGKTDQEPTTEINAPSSTM